MTPKIEITSDFICPWCLVAETRLNKAIEQLDSDLEIEKIWHSYELNPTMSKKRAISMGESRFALTE